jgi:hypothetical protein
MKNKTPKMSDFAKRLTEGLKRSFEKLVLEKAKNNGELIFSDGKKIYIIKAAKLLKAFKK